jgi:hypothetical protein
MAITGSCGKVRAWYVTFAISGGCGLVPPPHRRSMFSCTKANNGLSDTGEMDCL